MLFYYTGLAAAVLWVLCGIFIGQRYYRMLRDEQAFKPWPALGLAVGYGFVRPPYRLLKGLWTIVKEGFVKKRDA